MRFRAIAVLVVSAAVLLGSFSGGYSVGFVHGWRVGFNESNEYVTEEEIKALQEYRQRHEATDGPR